MTQREEEQEACGNFPFKFFPPYYWHTWLVCVLKDQVCKPSSTDFQKGCGARRCFFSRSQRQILAGPRWDQMVWDYSCHLCLTRWIIILSVRGVFCPQRTLPGVSRIFLLLRPPWAGCFMSLESHFLQSSAVIQVCDRSVLENMQEGFSRPL